MVKREHAAVATRAPRQDRMAGPDRSEKKWKRHPAKGQERPIPLQISAVRRKKVFEFVTIDGDRYTVPYPWRGKKIVASSPNMSALARIPAPYAWNDGTLYIRKEARDAFVAMARKANEDGVELLVHSGYRSIDYQTRIFSKLLARGRTWDDVVRYVAPPGYSEHMLGFAIDLYPSNWEFASTEAYRWLQEHAAAFGFEETYPRHGGDGFPWEAWHWRYQPALNAAAADGAVRE